MIARLAYISLRTAPMPYTLLKLAEYLTKAGVKFLLYRT